MMRLVSHLKACMWMSYLYSKCTTVYEYINLKLFNEFILYYNTIKEK